MRESRTSGSERGGDAIDDDDEGWHRREAQQNPKSPLPRASRLLAQSPPGIGRKRPSLPGQLPGDRASAVSLQLPQMRPVG